MLAVMIVKDDSVLPVDCILITMAEITVCKLIILMLAMVIKTIVCYLLILVFIMMT